ncbi:uncharacterized protein IWZ02DRAFT_226173 [Phyllosticta citriasiana]|uniref:uncharacterized protein n=1 Tax=Phyllosticta citriasiana TaxID=595635 RepID=UPI0030FDBEC7
MVVEHFECIHAQVQAATMLPCCLWCCSVLASLSLVYSDYIPCTQAPGACMHACMHVYLHTHIPQLSQGVVAQRRHGDRAGWGTRSSSQGGKRSTERASIHLALQWLAKSKRGSVSCKDVKPGSSVSERVSDLWVPGSAQSCVQPVRLPGTPAHRWTCGGGWGQAGQIGVRGCEQGFLLGASALVCCLDVSSASVE